MTEKMIEIREVVKISQDMLDDNLSVIAGIIDSEISNTRRVGDNCVVKVVEVSVTVPPTVYPAVKSGDEFVKLIKGLRIP